MGETDDMIKAIKELKKTTDKKIHRLKIAVAEVEKARQTQKAE